MEIAGTQSLITLKKLLIRKWKDFFARFGVVNCYAWLLDKLFGLFAMDKKLFASHKILWS